MTTPEQALAQARAEAARRREAGEADDALPGFAVRPTDRVSERRLSEWALIDVDLEKVASTRRMGAPITWAKRALARALRQYLGQAHAQQSRFNSQVVVHLLSLDQRVSELERRAGIAVEPDDEEDA
ncbi:MAG TPA: hypothetical protein VIM22_02965 [Solirubrobacteraceae bacterium]